MDLTKELLEHYNIQQTLVSAYHPQANDLVERGHDALVNSLAKYSKTPGEWKRHLPLALWADRIVIRRSIGYSAFELLYGRDCLLPVQLSIQSWRMIDWEEVKSREDLLMTRMKQLDQRNLAEVQAAENLRNSRKANKTYFDQHKRLRGDSGELHVGDLMLLNNAKNPHSRLRKEKLDDNWRGPYRIREIPENSTYYLLEELDDTHLATSIAGNRVKKFYSRMSFEEARDEIITRDEEIEEESDDNENEED